MERQIHHTPLRVPNRTFSIANVRNETHQDFSAGRHQKIVREPGGAHVLIVRRDNGIVERLRLTAFINGVIA